MGYRIRVLSTSPKCVAFSKLESAIRNEGLKAKLRLEVGTAEDWTQVILSHADGTNIAMIERNPVEGDPLGSAELEEFADEIADGKPASAARWLIDYFPRVQCIYALQLLSGTEHKNGWDIVGAIKNEIWSFAPSILQADSEGFSNEDGYHILWQFSDTVSGPWWMAILRDGNWVAFEMDLGNRRQREAFFRGEIPEGAKLAD